MLTYLGFTALFVAGLFLYIWVQDKADSLQLLLSIAAGVATVALFSAAAWLGRVRRRSELRREYRLHHQAMMQAELQEQRRQGRA